MITETTRHEAPSSYLMKMAGFVEIKSLHEPYESAVFDAVGHKWRLIVYPAGHENDGKNHVSVYARIENVVEMLNMKVELKFFIYNHNHRKYSVFQGGGVKHYNMTNKELGLAKMLTLSKFHDPKHGYIHDDVCIFGVEILVVKATRKVERVVFTRNPHNHKFTWTISHFSKLGDARYHYSPMHVVGDRKWRMTINPKGDKEKHGLSVYLDAKEFLPNAIVSSTYARFKLRLVNQKNCNHIEHIARHNYPKGLNQGYGRDVLISLKDLHDKSKGFLVNDTIILEAYLLCVTETKLVDVSF